MQLLYVLLRDVLRSSGPTVERRQGVSTPQTITNSLYFSNTCRPSTASSQIKYYRLASDQSQPYTFADECDSSGVTSKIVRSRSESFRIRVEAVSPHFHNSEKSRGTLAEVSNPTNHIIVMSHTATKNTFSEVIVCIWLLACRKSQL